MVNAESAVPLYSQMKENILERIHSGELKSGSRIPSEKELAKHYSVSLITVRRAISELVDAKVLEKKQGKGTFVLQRDFKRSFQPRAISFTEVCRNNNMTASAKLICGEIVRNAPVSILKKLELPASSPVVYIKRLRFADNLPIVIETTWFSMHYAYLLDIDLDHESIYKVLQAHEKDLRIISKSGERIIRLVTADKDVARFLNIRTGSVVLSTESITYNETTGEPVHASEHIGYAEKYNFAIVI